MLFLSDVLMCKLVKPNYTFILPLVVSPIMQLKKIISGYLHLISWFQECIKCNETCYENFSGGYVSLNFISSKGVPSMD